MFVCGKQVLLERQWSIDNTDFAWAGVRSGTTSSTTHLLAADGTSPEHSTQSLNAKDLLESYWRLLMLQAWPNPLYVTPPPKSAYSGKFDVNYQHPKIAPKGLKMNQIAHGRPFLFLSLRSFLDVNPSPPDLTAGPAEGWPGLCSTTILIITLPPHVRGRCHTR